MRGGTVKKKIRRVFCRLGFHRFSSRLVDRISNLKPGTWEKEFRFRACCVCLEEQELVNNKWQTVKKDNRAN